MKKKHLKKVAASPPLPFSEQIKTWPVEQIVQQHIEFMQGIDTVQKGIKQGDPRFADKLPIWQKGIEECEAELNLRGVLESITPKTDNL